jgi:hypothetical protein
MTPIHNKSVFSGDSQPLCMLKCVYSGEFFMNLAHLWQSSRQCHGHQSWSIIRWLRLTGVTLIWPWDIRSRLLSRQRFSNKDFARKVIILRHLLSRRCYLWHQWEQWIMCFKHTRDRLGEVKCVAMATVWIFRAGVLFDQNYVVTGLCRRQLSKDSFHICKLKLFRPMQSATCVNTYDLDVTLSDLGDA